MATPKAAIVTGGGTGIGKATAIRLAQEGWPVAVVGRRADRLEATVTEIEAGGGRACACPADLRVEGEVEEAVARISQTLGTVDLLVNNAGAARFASLQELSIDDFDLVMSTNLRGTVVMVRAVIPGMIGANSGCIINVSSEVSRRIAPGATAYGASKAAINYLTAVWAVELGRYGIRVNAVLPGVTDTPEGIVTPAGIGRAQAMDTAARRAPLGRVAAVADVAAAIAFLASAEAAYITGACVSVDGGLGLT